MNSRLEVEQAFAFNRFVLNRLLGFQGRRVGGKEEINPNKPERERVRERMYRRYRKGCAMRIQCQDCSLSSDEEEEEEEEEEVSDARE